MPKFSTDLQTAFISRILTFFEQHKFIANEQLSCAFVELGMFIIGIFLWDAQRFKCANLLTRVIICRSLLINSFSLLHSHLAANIPYTLQLLYLRILLVLLKNDASTATEALQHVASKVPSFSDPPIDQIRLPEPEVLCLYFAALHPECLVHALPVGLICIQNNV